MSDYRPAHRIREGWQVHLLPDKWLTVTHILRVYAPVNFVRLDLSDGDFYSCPPQQEIRCRTLAEVRAAS